MVGPRSALRLAMDVADRTRTDRITLTSNASAELARRSESQQLRRGAARRTRGVTLVFRASHEAGTVRGELLFSALLRCLVGAKANEARAVTKSIVARMVELHFDDELRTEWYPFGALPRLHRLGPPGARPVKPGSSRRRSTFESSAALSASGNAEQNPT